MSQCLQTSWESELWFLAKMSLLPRVVASKKDVLAHNVWDHPFCLFSLLAHIRLSADAHRRGIRDHLHHAELPDTSASRETAGDGSHVQEVVLYRVSRMFKRLSTVYAWYRTLNTTIVP